MFYGMWKYSRAWVITILTLMVSHAQDEMAKKKKTESIVITATQTYIKKHGLKAFAEEYYNLLGTKPTAVINEKNKHLALALGLADFVKDLPVKVSKKKVLTAVGPKRFKADRKSLSAFFLEQNALLDGAQQQMLGWHFAASDNYASVMSNDKRLVSVGWNVSAEIKGGKDFSSYTFGMVGCTALAAVAGDGSVHFSHFDGVANGTQVKIFSDFQKRFANPDVYVIGYHAKTLAAAVKSVNSKLRIYVHAKAKYLETNYTVHLARKNGELIISHASTAVAGDYISSIHNGSYGRWFAHGRFSEILPPADKSFVKTSLIEYK
ncbi:MAG: hypothetical protein HRT89_05020 [Lentisphaeria bacterium]|nr:hypothetical protein [Lentisphaeria bacterium]NQZ67411.1 hypothetical protein [Lentisphaeria bacterium]